MASSDKVSSESVKKISKDVIKTDKIKTRTAKRKKSYGIYIYKVLIQVHPDPAFTANHSRYVFNRIHSLSY